MCRIRSPRNNNPKSRLAEKFEFGGGKALPEEMTGPVMPIPSEERWKAAEKRRISGVMRRRRGLPEDDEDECAASMEGGRGGAVPATTMFDQVPAALLSTVVPAARVADTSCIRCQIQVELGIAFLEDKKTADARFSAPN